MIDRNSYERGSEWRQWDLHIHTPASFHWKGEKFDPKLDSEKNRKLVDEMIAAINASEPAVFALMDYWNFDGWFALRRRLNEPGAPQLTKTVFPGIELRLMAPTNCRLNAHVLFSDEVDDQILEDFKSSLNVEIVNRPLSNHSLMALARTVQREKLEKHGFKKLEIDKESGKALIAGATMAEINCDSYKAAIEKVPEGHAVCFMPFDTNDGLSEVDWVEHYAFFIGLINTSLILESRKQDFRCAVVGEETNGNKKYINSIQQTLKKISRLVVSGSDAHCFVGVQGDNNKRGYGDFPSGKKTWIKADPTFLGLLQAIKEPAKRSFIGERPQKKIEVTENKTFFIDRVVIDKIPEATTDGRWLEGTNLPLNPDLVAIIGNKGSGKSALTDVIALLGNSRQKDHFSFLKKNRFRGKTGEPASNFIASLTWLDGRGRGDGINLNADPPEDAVECVRYIPQGHFENLCNVHVSGQSNAFEDELRSVIFSHTDESIRQGAYDFNQLIEQQESGFRDKLNELRKDLNRINQEIINTEDQLQPNIKNILLKSHDQKLILIEEHHKIKPDSKQKPDTELSQEQQEAAKSIENISANLKDMEEAVSTYTTRYSSLAGKLISIKNVRERLLLLERHYKQFLDDTSQDLIALETKGNDIAVLTINLQSINNLTISIHEEQEQLKLSAQDMENKKVELLKEKNILTAKLNNPQLIYEQYLKDIDSWERKLAALTGASDMPETLKGLQSRIKQLEDLPNKLEHWSEKRIQLTGEIFDVLDEQRKSRENLYKPVQDLIKNNTLMRDEYKIQFQATLGSPTDALGEGLFALIKQNTGEFRGEEESMNVVRSLMEQYDFNKRDGALNFVTQLHDKISKAANGNQGTVGISSVLRKNKTASDVYNFIFDLSFLKTRYSLLFQGAMIEQLSPGQRGALLLIFYLLVDKGQKPIILDQPEENLDNETVVSLLVPVLTEAKKQRQIIMVTHNPNLAVVCDAEQVIWSEFDRKNASKISYLAGSIENPGINKHIVNVLEGTMPAFENRSGKYQHKELWGHNTFLPG